MSATTPKKSKQFLPFWPHYMLSEFIAWYVMLAVLIALASLLPADLQAKADAFRTPPRSPALARTPYSTSNDRSSTATTVTIAPLVPVIDEVTVSVAVIVWFPGVKSVALNVPAPFVSVELAGSAAAPSVEVKWTVPA